MAERNIPNPEHRKNAFEFKNEANGFVEDHYPEIHIQVIFPDLYWLQGYNEEIEDQTNIEKYEENWYFANPLREIIEASTNTSVLLYAREEEKLGDLSLQIEILASNLNGRLISMESEDPSSTTHYQNIIKMLNFRTRYGLHIPAHKVKMDFKFE